MRDNGYYWILLNSNKYDPVTENGWEVAYYERGKGWSSIWDGGFYGDSELKQIDEKRILRE